MRRISRKQRETAIVQGRTAQAAQLKKNSGKKKAVGAPTPTAKLNNFYTRDESRPV